MQWVILGIIVVVVLYVMSVYNKLVQFRQRVKNAWSQIDVQLRRRYDLIPNLVNTVKGYMSEKRWRLSRTQERERWLVVPLWRNRPRPRMRFQAP